MRQRDECRESRSKIRSGYAAFAEGERSTRAQCLRSGPLGLLSAHCRRERDTKECVNRALSECEVCDGGEMVVRVRVRLRALSGEFQTPPNDRSLIHSDSGPAGDRSGTGTDLSIPYHMTCIHAGITMCLHFHNLASTRCQLSAHQHMC